MKKYTFSYSLIEKVNSAKKGKKAKKINEKLKSANKKIRFLIFLCYTTNVVKYQ